MSKQDYYTTLGVSRDASPDDLKKAYRKLAMEHHPDRNAGNPESEAEFKRISEAYEVLSDPQKRAAYDRYGNAAFDGSAGFGGFGAGGGFDFGGFSSVMEEMFNQFSGGGRGHSTADMSGSDLRYDIDITLREAFEGVTKTIHVPTRIACQTCQGTGLTAKSREVMCSTCHGAGRVRMSQGFFVLEQTCTACQGLGHIIENPCSDCRGMGRLPGEHEIEVKIPVGVDSGTRLRVAGKGEAGMRGAHAGDLYIFVTVNADKTFEREGADLHCIVTVPMTVAALGGQITVKTLDDTEHLLEIPEGTQTGRTFVMKGLGMPLLQRERRGNLHVVVHVSTPTQLTTAQKETLQRFAEQYGETPEPLDGSQEGFFQKMRHFFS